MAVTTNLAESVEASVRRCTSLAACDSKFDYQGLTIPLLGCLRACISDRSAIQTCISRSLQSDQYALIMMASKFVTPALCLKPSSQLFRRIATLLIRRRAEKYGESFHSLDFGYSVSSFRLAMCSPTPPVSDSKPTKKPTRGPGAHHSLFFEREHRLLKPRKLKNRRPCSKSISREQRKITLYQDRHPRLLSRSPIDVLLGSLLERSTGHLYRVVHSHFRLQPCADPCDSGN